MTEQNLHAKLSPSSSQRWLACPGSIQLTDKVAPYQAQERSSPSAELGTLAHEYCEKLLQGNTSPSEIPEELVDGVTEYVAVVTNYQTEYGKGAKLYVETRVQNPRGTPHVFGTADAIVISKDKKRLAVIDYKNGVMPVVAEENWQLICYAVLAAGHFGISPKKVDLVIVQPNARDRLPSVREWSISKKELKLYEAEINRGADLALSPAGAQIYNPGEAQCRFCPVAGHCTAQARQGAIADFFEGPPPTAILSTEQMAEMLAAIPEVDAYINALRKAAYERAMADETLPGFKLVHSRTVRKWDDAKAVEKILRENKIDKALYLDTKLKSFTKLEKLNETAELVADHIIKPVGVLQLAPESDPREAAAPGDDFKDDL